MSKQKIWSDFNCLECGKTEKNLRRNMEFHKRVEISSAAERTVFPDGSKLGKNETYNPDTLIIHFRLDRLLYA